MDIREWLIQNGISPEELDHFEELPVIRDVGEALTLSLQNDDDIGQMLVAMLMRMDEQDAQIAALRDEISALKGEGA
ncbi:hypothetical protein [Paenibacillus xanthanilyticus]|uniref:Chaperone modulatory protein CbpM n=1 Tax=Paenibacillus xanthanilyticus TaxID=1783531 RepID=A0ABV8KC22_9BACL